MNHHPIYSESDPVVILDDGCFIGNKIKSQYYMGPGIIKAYSPSCYFCQDMVKPLNKLARKVRGKSAVYVIDVTDNPIFNLTFDISKYPTFYHVSNTGYIEQELDGKIETLETALGVPLRSK